MYWDSFSPLEKIVLADGSDDTYSLWEVTAKARLVFPDRSAGELVTLAQHTLHNLHAKGLIELLVAPSWETTEARVLSRPEAEVALADENNYVWANPLPEPDYRYDTTEMGWQIAKPNTPLEIRRRQRRLAGIIEPGNSP